MTTTEVSDDPFADHLRRDPLPNAGIRIILLTDCRLKAPTRIIASLADLIAALGTARRAPGRIGR